MYTVNLLPELKEKVERPFTQKLLETNGMIASNLMNYKNKIAVAWSGGKDSTIVLYLVRQLCPDIPVIFNNTGIEYPETIHFVQQVKRLWNLNLFEVKPQCTYWDCINKFGFPSSKRGSKGGRHCCYYLKEKPMKQFLKEHNITSYFTGITAIENRTRMFLARDYGMCYTTAGIHKVHPILWWTLDDVKFFMKQMSLPVNQVYALGAERCGCMMCTAFSDWEKQLSLTKPKVYQFLKSKKEKLECH